MLCTCIPTWQQWASKGLITGIISHSFNRSSREGLLRRTMVDASWIQIKPRGNLECNYITPHRTIWPIWLTNNKLSWQGQQVQPCKLAQLIIIQSAVRLWAHNHYAKQLNDCIMSVATEWWYDCKLHVALQTVWECLVSSFSSSSWSKSSAV